MILNMQIIIAMLMCFTAGEQPGFYETTRQYRPGDFSYGDEIIENIEELVGIVIRDLTQLGYSGITRYNDFNDIGTINSSQELICMRMDLDVHDEYHFMRYENGNWYHKPSSSAVLKYTGVMSNDVPWKNEQSLADGEVLYENYVYNSDIVYIVYNKNQINTGANSTANFSKFIRANRDLLIEINFANAGHYIFDITSGGSGYQMQYNLYDDNYNIISSGTDETFYDYVEVSKGTYYLRVNFATGTPAEMVNIIVSPHTTHSYDHHYSWETLQQHYAYCVCGEKALRGHIVEAGTALKKNCILCYGRVSAGETLHPGSSDMLYTENGSYILPDGIIVLQEADKEAFFAGTLVFIDPNAPEVE